MNLSLALLATSFAAAADAMTFSSLSAQELVKNYFNNPDAPVEFRNIEAPDHSCFTLLQDGHSAGRHSNSNKFLLPNDAILMSTGKPEDFHINDSDETTTDLGIGTGDAHLEHNMGIKVLDPCFIQFEFSCPEAADIYTPQVSFDYVFGSEEYLQPKKKKEGGVVVNRGPHPDVLGFFLNGQNIALVPDENGGMVSVSIENVNEKRNTQNFVNNKFIANSTSVYSEIEADGFTTKLTAQGEAKPGWNIVKLAIADVGDGTLDSWVLLEAGSFSCTLGDAPKSFQAPEPEPEPEPVEAEPVEEQQAEEPVVASESASPKMISAVAIFFIVLFILVVVVWALLASGALRVNLKDTEGNGKTTVDFGEPDVSQMKARSIEMYNTIKAKVKAKSSGKFGSKKVNPEESVAASSKPAEKSSKPDEKPSKPVEMVNLEVADDESVDAYLSGVLEQC
eukprot:scaffold193_cov157-Skeletonema_menzelii.AAC.9